jgi:hypothetical protein
LAAWTTTSALAPRLTRPATWRCAYLTAPLLLNGVDTGLTSTPFGYPGSFVIKASGSGALLYALALVAGNTLTAQAVSFTAAAELVVVGTFASDRATFGYVPSAAGSSPSALVLNNANPMGRQAFIVKASSTGTVRLGAALGNDAAGAVAYDALTGALALTGVVSGAPSFFGDESVAEGQGFLFSRGGDDAWVA